MLGMPNRESLFAGCSSVGACSRIDIWSPPRICILAMLVELARASWVQTPHPVTQGATSGHRPLLCLLQHHKAAELTHRRRVAEGDVLLDRPETFERPKPAFQACFGPSSCSNALARASTLTSCCCGMQKVVLPPRNSWHYW